MISRIYKFLLVMLIVGIALYIVMLNKETITISLGSSSKLSANAGVIYISIFVLGVLCSAVVALFFGMKSYFRERRLQYRDKLRNEFYGGMLKARSFSVGGEWRKAGELWEQLAKKDPTDVIARMEISHCLEGAGELREALKVVDAARAVEPHNSEVLFRAAELNAALGNKTAALDNLALILFHQPNRKAAARARDLAEELEQFDKALEFQTKLESLAAIDDESEIARARLEYKRILAAHKDDRPQLEQALRAFNKKYPAYTPALDKLAALEGLAGNADAAAQFLIKAAKSDPAGQYWLEAVRLWLKNKNPDRALAAARAAIRDSSGLARAYAELTLLRVYLALNMLEDARQALDAFPALEQTIGAKFNAEISRDYLILRGLYYNRVGDSGKAAEIWHKLSDNDLQQAPRFSEHGARTNGAAPSPTLSTP